MEVVAATRNLTLVQGGLVSVSSGACLSGTPAAGMAMAMVSPFFGSRVTQGASLGARTRERRPVTVSAAMDSAKTVPYASYAVPLEASNSFITRPLAEILRDMNKRVPDKVLKTRTDEGMTLKYIPWYHANRMLSFYAPGWSGEVRSIVFSSDNSTVSVVYRVTIKGSDGEAWRESTGTASMADTQFGDPIQKAEGMAFRRACARFGLGLYLYHENEEKAIGFYRRDVGWGWATATSLGLLERVLKPSYNLMNVNIHVGGAGDPCACSLMQSLSCSTS